MNKDRFKFRAWDKPSDIFPDGCMTYFNIHKGIGDVDIIMQCTGLKDKNDKLIYEGDIFYYTGEDNLLRVCKIGYCNDKMGFEPIQICEGDEDPLWAFVDGWETYETPKYLSTIKIVGNIYENPELLEND
jgi:uncharacterized phage protein (TIGR01671 family)